MAIRSFIALSVPDALANSLGDCAAQMAYQDKSNAVRWVDQANFHITLAFLGEQSEQDLYTLADQLDQRLHAGEVDVCVGGVSPFPEARPKLIAAMIDRSEELATIHQQTLASIAATGLKNDKRKFIPHITLGRLRHSKKPFAGVFPANFTAQATLAELLIYESNLTPQGAEYEALFRFPLDPLDFYEV